MTTKIAPQLIHLVHLMSTAPTTGTIVALTAACGATVQPALRWMATSHIWAATCPACQQANTTKEDGR